LFNKGLGLCCVAKNRQTDKGMRLSPLVPTVTVFNGIAWFVGVGFTQGRAGSFTEQSQVIDLGDAS
jgi:hypothetical protein